MARKKDTNIPLPGDTDSDFTDSRDFLEYKPIIDFVEPEQENYQEAYKNADELQEAIKVTSAAERSTTGITAESGTGVPELDELLRDLGEREQARLKEQQEEGSLDELRDRTAQVVNGLEAVTKLVDLAQKRVDQRVNAAGGLTVKLDPVKDAHVIAAMKRKFPDKDDPTQITYDDYKKALDCSKGPDVTEDNLPVVKAKDIRDAKADPNRTNFGGIDNQHGENRPEISSPVSNLDPINLNKFQKEAVKALFALMLPLIMAQDQLSIAQHLVTAPHKPI